MEARDNEASATKTSSGDRQSLPFSDIRHQATKEVDPSKAKMPAIKELVAPAKAPYVLVILLDDLGFGGPASFGGPLEMPTFDRLAKNGLRYNRFHTVALCAPTRAALRSGRN